MPKKHPDARHGAHTRRTLDRDDHGTADFLLVCRAIIQNAWSPGTHHVILNLQDVDFMDGTAPGVLAPAHLNLMTRNVTMSLVGPQRHIKKNAGPSELSTPAYATEALALQSWPNPGSVDPRVFDNPEITKRSSSPTRDSSLISSRE